MSAEIVYLPITLRDLSHELRTPLAGILGTLYQLEEEPLTFQQQSYLADIKNAGGALLRLANNLAQAKRLSDINKDELKRLIKQYTKLGD